MNAGEQDRHREDRAAQTQFGNRVMSIASSIYRTTPTRDDALAKAAAVARLVVAKVAEMHGDRQALKRAALDPDEPSICDVHGPPPKPDPVDTTPHRLEPVADRTNTAKEEAP